MEEKSAGEQGLRGVGGLGMGGSVREGRGEVMWMVERRGIQNTGD